MFDRHFVCSDCSLSAFVHLISQSVKLLTALLIGTCGRLSQITNASLSSVIVFWMELVIGLQHRAQDVVVHGSGESEGHWSFLVNSGS